MFIKSYVMRILFFFSLLEIFSVIVEGQTDARLTVKTASASSTRWDLDRYVWSHTHGGNLKPGKQILDFDAIDKWVSLDASPYSVGISGDGKYIAYATFLLSPMRRIDTFWIRATDNSWCLGMKLLRPGFFSADSRQYIYMDKNELCFLALGSDQRQKLQHVASYKLPTNDGRNKWLAIELKEPKGSLILRNLLTGEEIRFTDVSAYDFDPSGNWLVCQMFGERSNLLLHNIQTSREVQFKGVTGYSLDESGHELVFTTIQTTENGSRTALNYVILPEGQPQVLWETTDSSESIDGYSFGRKGEQLALLVNHKMAPEYNSMWYWHQGMQKAELKINGKQLANDSLWAVQGPITFIGNSQYIQFSLKPIVQPLLPPEDNVPVDIWGSRDSIMQIEQAEEIKNTKLYKAFFSLQNNKLVKLEDDRTHEVPWLQLGDYVVISESNADLYHDQFWKPDYSKFTNWLVSLKDGSRLLLPTSCDPNYMRSLQNGRFLVYYDRWQNSNYFSYDVFNGKVTNISNGIPAYQLGYRDPYLHTPDRPFQPYGIATFLSDQGLLLVYDAYDIWQLDITGKKKPKNITNGYGRLHHIMFSLLEGDRGENNPDNPAFVERRVMVLRAFNRQTKESGYFKIELNNQGNPEKLFLKPYFFERLWGISSFTAGLHPVKAADTFKWVVMRQSATEAPNYFLTEDFKTYRQITGFNCHKHYNWITTELHQFKQKDGTISQGVLYKPENFDPTKKYPVIISFYGALSDQLYQYPIPDYISAPDISGAPSSPAWMVSHGYLVFTPDIYFTKNKWGPSVLNTIDGAVDYLQTLKYVDGKHKGSGSHSNGGNFGYYVFTHTKKLAAMSVGSGNTNLMATSFSLTESGKANFNWIEEGHYGTGLGELWRYKESWIEHTAVLHADKANCPILMFHNRRDGGLGAGGAVDMYLSLRRLGKPAWWLQYDRGLHTVSGDDARDLTIRYTQFFDHYLKGAPAPKWMTRGVSYSGKGVDTGYDLDTVIE
jgi:hypothetical protein